MDSTNPIVLDISSDEEPDPHGDDYNWLTGVLDAVDRKSEDSDEVVVVSVVKSSVSCRQKKSRSTEPTLDDDDDDCVVLDGDPDKSVAELDDDNAAETDEVLVVGQKGQIACRDFPHSRHTCAIYPFSSTPHDKYCDMCHCYVCDTRAPCPYWCVGVSTIDHCHANEKEDIWKNQRRYFKAGNKTPAPISKPHTTATLYTVPPQPNRGSTQGIVRLPPNSLPQSQVSIRACSSSTSTIGLPNIRAQCRIRQQSRSVLNNQGFQPRSQQLLGRVRDSVIRKDRALHSVNNTNRNPQFGSSNTTPGNPRLGGGCSVARLSGYPPLNHNRNNNVAHGHGLPYTQIPSSLASPNNPWQDVSVGVNAEMHTQQNISQPNLSAYFSAMPSPQSQAYSQHIDSSCQNQTNVNQCSMSETSQPTGSCQDQSFQEPELKDFPRNKLLSDFENWLLDNHAVPDCSSSETVGLNESTFTFDFETFLDN